VYAYVVRRVGDRDAAQDLTSDVFHKALASIQNYRYAIPRELAAIRSSQPAKGTPRHC
jgi:DNA-directed RNA polymerase specialized sigma24 family protein